MKKHILHLPVLILCLVMTAACSSSHGYQINGIAKAPTFEGRTVYLTDPYDNNKLYDSTTVIQGKFSFSDSTSINAPYMRVLSLPVDEDGKAHRLPVVIENGKITTELGDIVCTSGTALNDKLQDYLLGIDEFIESVSKHADWEPEDVRAQFADLWAGHVSANANNIVGVYIYKIYRPNVSDDIAQSLLNRHPWLKEQVEN